MSDETPQERQDNEIEALKAIFGDQIVDNRQNQAWKVWRPIDVLLTLHPLHSSSVVGVHCSVTLHIQCCANYPEKPPKIAISKLHGLSNSNGIKLLGELEELAAKSCGEVMIYELAQHVQNFLYAFNKPTLSFYDEMLERKNEAERLKQHDIKVKENEERQKMKTEIQRRQEILKTAERHRVHRNSLSQEKDTSGAHGDVAELVCYADKNHTKSVTKPKAADVPCNCEFKGIHVMRLASKNNKKIHIGKCLGHSQNGSTTFMSLDADSGESLITKKWTLHPATDFQTRNKQFNLMEQDLRTISRIKHKNITPYLAMELTQETVKRTSVQCVYLFREFVLGCSLKFLTAKCSFSDNFEALRLLRHVAIGVFSALKELHSDGIVHRDVTSENLYLDEGGEVKLVGVGLDVRLAEIIDGESQCDRHTKTLDIFMAAQVLLTILSHQGTGHEIPSQLPSSAKDFFSRCLTEDEHLQWSAEQLLGHGFLKDGPCAAPGGKLHDDGYSGSEDEDKALGKSLVSHCLPASGHSRLSAEFEVLKWLGKGAFGDVLKVKNKLDGGFYALKRIKLNPENVQMNKKITREVKLLSRLNHEHVVRYFNAWIETAQAADTVDSPDTSAAQTPVKKRPSNDTELAIAKLAPGVKLEWSISESMAKRRESSDDESGGSSDEDEVDGWFKILPVSAELESENSSSIEFEVTTNQSETIPSESIPDRPPTLIQQVLYIQMEFCEKNTLRHAIDNGLHAESFRAWRLFREIVEGLNHVHQRGMIHRDLKPVNIFLDSNDHVKIGDFGLATKAFTGMSGILDDKNKQNEEFGGSLTGQIGTALYVAPELLQSANKVIYNQKVDIYSLGIILFEMFHKPLDTGMERMKVLTELRLKDIVMPAGFVVEENSKKVEVIRWLLSHEPGLRPTCAELLASERVPRAVPEGALSALLAHTLSERGSRSYRRLADACLDQRPTPAEDYTYHTATKPDLTLLAVKSAVTQVFKSHGACEFSPSLLVPRARRWEGVGGSGGAVRLMAEGGHVCHLPHDLRLPFARHIAYTEVQSLRRYATERVFRARREGSLPPREMLECAFDIVTPRTGSLWADAELVLVASQAARAARLRAALSVNHAALLRALLACCGVPEDRHADLYPVLVDVRLGRITNLQLQTHLTSLCITNRDISNLLRLMESEVCVSEVAETIAPLTRRPEWTRIINRAIADIETVIKNAKALGLDCPISVAPCLAYNATQHSGVFWLLSVKGSGGKGRRAGDLIAVGGRYDVLVEEFWQTARSVRDRDAELKTSAVGFSMSLERMAAILKNTDVAVTDRLIDDQTAKISICVHGTIDNSREGQRTLRRAQLARDVWASGRAARLVETEAREQTAASIVLEEEDGCVRATCWDDNRVREHRIPFIDVVDFLKHKLDQDKSPEVYNRAMSWSESEKCSNLNISVTFITLSDKMTRNSRRQCENQNDCSVAQLAVMWTEMRVHLGAIPGGANIVIMNIDINSQITNSLSRLGVSRARVFALALASECSCVRALAAALEPDGGVNPRSLANVIECFPKRRKIIEEAIEEMQSISSSHTNQSRSQDEPLLFALYSIPDAVCKIIL